MTQSMNVQTGSGNIFEDLGLENAEELLVKAELARKISGIVTSLNMTQSKQQSCWELINSKCLH